jgi:DNA primase
VTAAGRKPLLTQAIMLVLHHPGAAKSLGDLAALRGVRVRGVDVLVELLETAAAEPGLSTAQLVERWRERPEGARLAELAAIESLVPDRAAAERELLNALQKLVAEAGPGRRLDELIAASGERRLTAEEQLEFQELLNQRRPPGNAPG